MSVNLSVCLPVINFCLFAEFEFVCMSAFVRVAMCSCVRVCVCVCSCVCACVHVRVLLQYYMPSYN